MRGCGSSVGAAAGCCAPYPSFAPPDLHSACSVLKEADPEDCMAGAPLPLVSVGFGQEEAGQQEEKDGTVLCLPALVLPPPQLPATSPAGPQLWGSSSVLTGLWEHVSSQGPSA